MHFYGMSLKEINGATYEQLVTLYEAITMIEAQEQLKAMAVADWPKKKPQARKKAHKEIYAQAYPKEFRVKKYVDVKDVQAALAKTRR